jgi:hypothetical protein
MSYASITAGSYTLNVQHVDGDAERSAVITINSTPTTVKFTGTNTIEFSNPTAYAPDIDHLLV